MANKSALGLSDADEQALARVRAGGDFAINSALVWIERYHAIASQSLIMQLTRAIRELSKTMHGRSDTEIQEKIAALLSITGDTPLLSSGRTKQDNTSVPRVHADWSSSRYFEPEVHQDRPTKQKKGPVFISYAREDSEWLARLIVHMRPLERAGRIELWHDKKIRTGLNWRGELDRALLNSSVAILLVSANFMASDFIYANELPPLATRAKDGGVVVFPVFVGHCLFDADENLRTFQSFNDPESPLSRLDSAHVDQLLVRLAKCVQDLCESM